jgi:hypothetical protein
MLALGLLAGNGAMVSTTVLAASGPHLLGGLLGLGSGNGAGSVPLSTGLGGLQVQLPQQVCQLAPALCQPGTRFFQIPTGVVTLGKPLVHTTTTTPKTHTHVTLPVTGCILGIIGSCHTNPTPAPTAPPTARPTSIVGTTTTTTTTTTRQATSSPAATASPAPGGCLLGIAILGPCSTGQVTNSCTQSQTGGCQATPAPAPSPGNSTCILICSLLQLNSPTCAVSALGICALSNAPSQSTAPGSSGPGAGACVASICLLGSECTASVGNSCLLGALLPGVLAPILGGGGGANQPPSPGGSSGGGSTSSGPSSSAPQSTSPTGTASTEPITGYLQVGSSQPATSGSSPSSINPNPTQGGDATVGLVSGISFGHGLILWPLFGLLDLAALAGLVVVVRRRWSATTS